jgi:hypothetical protein
VWRHDSGPDLHEVRAVTCFWNNHPVDRVATVPRMCQCVESGIDQPKSAAPAACRSSGHGHGVAPDHPDAMRHTGTIVSVHHAAGRVVAYLAECRSAVAGTPCTDRMKASREPVV